MMWRKMGIFPDAARGDARDIEVLEHLTFDCETKFFSWRSLPRAVGLEKWLGCNIDCMCRKRTS